MIYCIQKIVCLDERHKHFCFEMKNVHHRWNPLYYMHVCVIGSFVRSKSTFKSLLFLNLNKSITINLKFYRRFLNTLMWKILIQVKLYLLRATHSETKRACSLEFLSTVIGDFKTTLYPRNYWLFRYDVLNKNCFFETI